MALYLVARRVLVRRRLAAVYQRDALSADIARFYDTRSAAWESVWGEHMHHGLYDRAEDGNIRRGVAAQIHTMDTLLSFSQLDAAALRDSRRVLDVGCGIGGASRFLARAMADAHVTGITLSPVQAARAVQLNTEAQLSERVSVAVQDVNSMSFPDDHFGLVWSLESAEHMPDKTRFIQSCSRVLQPGRPLVMLAWCIRESTPPLSPAERLSIRGIMQEYCLPRVAPPSEYVTEMLRAGLRHVRYDDWTDRAKPFWREVVRSAFFNRKGWSVLWQEGWPLIRSALAMRHVIKGIDLGVFRLVAFSGIKPTVAEVGDENTSKLDC